MYLGTIQENKNGNGKLTLTADNLKFACAELGIPDDSHTLRRAARAFDLYYTDKVEHVNDHTFKVASQYDRQRPYQVTIHEGATKPYGYCTCQDWMNYSGDMDVPNVDFWCKHMISAALWLHNNGNGKKRIVSESGSLEAKKLQDRLNGNNGSNNNGTENSGNSRPSTDIDPSAKPFMESDALDAKQIETGEGGKVHHLSNGEYVISYKGIMHLADKHGIITETWDDTPKSGFVTVKAMRKDTKNVRKSVQPVNGSFEIAEGKAKRNAVRMLIPIVDIRSAEHKFKLETEFDWQKAKSKCVELAGTEANVDIIIHDLTQAGKLRKDNPSHYDRTEWLIIYDACKQDASDNGNDGDNSPSPVNPNWREWYDKCVDVSSIHDTSIIINRVVNDHNAKYRKDKISDDDWEKIFDECQKRRETYEKVQATKGERAFLQKQYEYDYIQAKTGFNIRRKQIDKIFEGSSIPLHRPSRRNGSTTKNLTKLYDEKPLEFQVDTTKPNWVTLRYSNGTVAKVYDQTIYESVLRST